jgi:hypothetical protein
MATTKDSPPAPPEGISPEQRAAMDAYVTEMAALGGPPPPAPPAQPAAVTDEAWSTMTDRARENWVANQVGWTLEELAKLDADKRRDAEIEALKNKAPEPEASPADAPPTLLQKFQKFMWGEQK